VHSPTNAAVLRGRGLDLVVVISPMSGPAGWLPDVYAASRRHAARLLRHEVGALRRAGVRTVVFAPGAAEQRAMGNDMMSRHDLGGVIQQSFLAAGAYAATPEVADLIRAAVDRRSG
jgi:NTE family protein